MQVMSGFRTPRYNHSGGNTAGRANLSRHMYGDAADVFVDNDRNGSMDDINGDGRVDTATPKSSPRRPSASSEASLARRRHRRLHRLLRARTVHAHRRSRLSRALARIRHEWI